MPYGVNFGLPPIPEHLERRIAGRIKHDGASYWLVGLAETDQQLRYMLITANNGRRKLHTVTHTIKGTVYHAIYAG